MGLGAVEKGLLAADEKRQTALAHDVGYGGHAGVDDVDPFVRRGQGYILGGGRADRAMEQDQRPRRGPLDDAVFSEHAVEHVLIGADDHIDDGAGLGDFLG